MSARNQRICIYSVLVYMSLLLLGLVISGFLPPPNPENSASEVAAVYRENANSIRTGMVLCLYGLVFYIPWVAAFSVQLKRIEGRHSPLTYAQLGLGFLLPVSFFPALYFFQTAAYRPERSDEAILQLHDMGWLPFSGIIYTVFVQNIVIGLAVLSDKHSKPHFPRWYGYFTFWIALLYCPASLDVFFTDGPLAWNGLLSWWLSLTANFVWMLVSTALLLKAVKRQEHEEGGAALSVPEPLLAG